MTIQEKIQEIIDKEYIDILDIKCDLIDLIKDAENEDS